jgi:hypothetical protein
MSEAVNAAAKGGETLRASSSRGASLRGISRENRCYALSADGFGQSCDTAAIGDVHIATRRVR